MYKIAKASTAERQSLFHNTASKKGMPAAIIEKDFWVCLTLDYLFHKCPWKNKFAFKGGTSLSKAYGLIERFSEDIDLILDWRTLGYSINQPWEERSKSKQTKFNEEANSRAADFLSNSFLPQFREDISEVLGAEATAYIAQDDPQTVNFEYPCEFENEAILRVIRLEIGALAAWTPTQLATILPYAAEEYKHVFRQPQTKILTTTAARTFWEKVTILHHEAHRPETSSFLTRYSRHYYDLYCMAQTQVKKEALEDLELLQCVVKFKQKFYPRTWAHYELAKPGTLRLLPPPYNERALQEDYAFMQNMIFGMVPSYEKIRSVISDLEREINEMKAEN
ncbi:MAG: nucleotidyl transferase AbiEii/AbiGii toxin family protein [Lentisphaeria bacterium]|jgi:hypothetical protein